MGIMTAFGVGVSGLRASQNAINTTSHNLANVNTEGYVRQQVIFSDTSYQNLGAGGVNTMQVGIGVDLSEVRRVRDELLDKAFRQENGRQAFYEEQYLAVNEVQEMLGELQGVAFQDYLTEFLGAIQEVAKEPLSGVHRATLVENAVAFMDRANSIYSSLVNYQETLNVKVQKTVNRINDLGSLIYDLNGQIAKAEAPGIEKANDLRDLRDSALDELSSLVNISYNELSDGKVTVKVEGVAFVTENTHYDMATARLDAAKDSNLLTPVWPYLDDRTVYNLNEEVSTVRNTDIGALRSILITRGNATANYTDIPNPENYAGGSTDAQYLEDLRIYDEEVAQSSIRTVMAEFDQLIHSIVTAVNDVLCPNTTVSELTDEEKNALIDFEYTDLAGRTQKITGNTVILDAEEAGYGCGDSRVQGTELFSRDYTERYTEVTVEVDGEDKTYYIYNEDNSFGNESLYTLGNIRVNETVLRDNDTIPLSQASGAEYMEKAEALVDIWESADLKLTPYHNTQKAFIEYYTEFVNQIADSGNLYENMIDQQQDMTDGIDGDRQRIMGVSSDEELANLIKFQAAYNASSRYINVIDQMLEHLITRL